MRYKKTRCVHCINNSNCSSVTKLFVNYAGSQKHMVKERVRKAEKECKKMKEVRP